MMVLLRNCIVGGWLPSRVREALDRQPTRMVRIVNARYPKLERRSP